MSQATPTHGPPIGGNRDNVLPVLPLDVLDSVFCRLTPSEIHDALKFGLVPAAWLPNATYYASASQTADREAVSRGWKIVGRILPHDYRRAVKQRLGPRLIGEATFKLARHFQLFSAARRLTFQQCSVAAGVSSALITGAFFVPHLIFIFVSLSFSMFFLSLIAVRVMCLLPQGRIFEVQPVALDDTELPTYSVLVPLFRETTVLDQLIAALAALEYPKELLDIKLILEENDLPMQRAVANLTLSSQFDVVVVPAGKPQTKPRALNYALKFCRGDLVTIFDAEDVPDPGQLLLAAETFAACPEHIACLQAQLVFFNRNESWLTRQFAVEYATLFGIVLPTLATEELPLPLGGTSNHFRRNILERIGGWDPFNVTEDADLGMRLARSGYRTGTIESETLEEANTRPLSWVKQRSRWLKGFLQTWLVHMRSPVTTFRELGPGGFWIFQAVTLGVFVSALLHPLLLAHALYILATGWFVDPHSILSTILAGLNLSVLALGYTVSVMLGRRAIAGTSLKNERSTLWTMPFYWMLMMPAAWLALWDFVFKPFDWRKTEHGHSKLKPTTEPAGSK